MGLEPQTTGIRCNHTTSSATNLAATTTAHNIMCIVGANIALKYLIKSSPHCYWSKAYNYLSGSNIVVLTDFMVQCLRLMTA